MQLINGLDTSLVNKVKDTFSLEQAVYATLRKAIANGTFQPGDWLREENLARELGVSRVPVRAAINQLAVEGLAVREPKRGVRLVVLPIDELQDIYEMRISLEGSAMQLAAEQITAEELAKMKALLDTPLELNNWQSVLRFQEVNREFHFIAIQASHRRQLSRILGQLLDLTFSYLYLRESHPQLEQPAKVPRRKAVSQLKMELRLDQMLEQLLENTQEHQALVEALEARDGARARQVITLHLQKTLDWLRTYAKEGGP